MKGEKNLHANIYFNEHGRTIESIVVDILKYNSAKKRKAIDKGKHSIIESQVEDK